MELPKFEISDEDINRFVGKLKKEEKELSEYYRSDECLSDIESLKETIKKHGRFSDDFLMYEENPIFNLELLYKLNECARKYGNEISDSQDDFNEESFELNGVSFRTIHGQGSYTSVDLYNNENVISKDISINAILSEIESWAGHPDHAQACRNIIAICKEIKEKTK